MSKYAIVQAGLTCLGLGESLREVYANALALVGPDILGENVRVIKVQSNFVNACKNNDVIAVKCSDEYFKIASIDPTVKFKWDFDQITIDTDN
jgi:hypothetical protein